MLATEDEVIIWKNLGEKLSKFLSDIDNGRNEVMTLPWDETPEFSDLSSETHDVLLSIEGRIQELEPEYYERKAFTKKEAHRVQEATAYGINYVGLFGYWLDDEFDTLLQYIVSHGLASMKYKDTRKAVHEYRHEKLNEWLARRMQKNEALSNDV